MNYAVQGAQLLNLLDNKEWRRVAWYSIDRRGSYNLVQLRGSARIVQLTVDAKARKLALTYMLNKGSILRVPITIDLRRIQAVRLSANCLSLVGGTRAYRLHTA